MFKHHMKNSDYERLNRHIGYPIKNKDLIRAALTHPSYRNTRPEETYSACFQRLEFFGDAVLNFYIVRRLYKLFPDANEGLMSKLRSILVSRKLLSKIAKKIKLYQFLFLGKREQEEAEIVKDKIMADAFEALIAAIFFDLGQAKTEKFLEKYFKPYLNQKKLFLLDPNPKSTLQELTQKQYHLLPQYSNSMHKNNLFTVVVSLQGKLRTKGAGRNMREAEANAASLLIAKLKSRKRKLSFPKETALKI